MRMPVTSLALACALAAHASAAPIESLRSTAEQEFLSLNAEPKVLPFPFSQVPAMPRGRPDGASGAEELFIVPRTSPKRSFVSGQLLGEIALRERLDLQRDMLVKQLGAQTWDIGVAGDKNFKILFLTFRRSGVLKVFKINNIQDLRGRGVAVALDPRTVYNFRVDIDIFDPVRGSTLYITPVNGTRGPSHQLTTGELLDTMRAKSFVFNASGEEFWLLYTTDIDPAGSRPADTRSLVFFHEDGTNSKGYPVAESSLAVDKPLGVSLGGPRVTLLKTQGGKLRIFSDDSE